MESFSFTRVISRDVITDAFQGLRNFFGMRLVGYEKRLQETISKMREEMELKYKVKWFRFSINPLIRASIMVILYGEGEKLE